MRQIAGAAAAAAILGTGLYGAGLAWSAFGQAGGAPAEGALLLGLFLSLVALAVSLAAAWNAARACRQLTRMSHSIETAIAALDARAKSAEAERLQLEQRLRAEMDLISIRGASATLASLPADVIPHPAIAPKRRKPGPDPADAVELALARLLEDDELELSLEPIVSVSRNAGVCFEVHACVEFDGKTHHLHRLSSSARHVDRGLFEKSLVLKAAEIARRRLGSKSDRMPLHCPVSEALLNNEGACAEIAALMAMHPVLADQIVLSVPSPLLAATAGTARAGVDTLAASGLGFAAEGWDKPADGIRMLRDRGAVALKVEADRLLDRMKPRRGAASGVELAAAARAEGLPVVARGILSDEDAVELLDSGIDLMVGPRFAEPKRLRPVAIEPQRTMAEA